MLTRIKHQDGQKCIPNPFLTSLKAGPYKQVPRTFVFKAADKNATIPSNNLLTQVGPYNQVYL